MIPVFFYGTDLAVRGDSDPVGLADLLSLHQVACDAATSILLGGLPVQVARVLRDVRHAQRTCWSTRWTWEGEGR